MPTLNEPIILRNCLWEDILEVDRQFRRFSNHLFEGSFGIVNAQGEAGPHQGFVCLKCKSLRDCRCTQGIILNG